MSWITKLKDTYECSIGTDDGPLPVGYTKKGIKYHVILRADGSFDHAEEYAKNEFLAVPTSPKAEARTGANGLPYPLAEQLQYLVCEEGHPNPRYSLYMKALEEWCAEPDAPNCLHILYSYLERKTLLSDMMEKSGLKVKYSTKDAYGKGEDSKAFLTFSIHCTDGEDRLWMRSDICESWSKRLLKTASDRVSLCYADGVVRPVMESHPKIQKKAKLVSSKDNEYPFLYKGRFLENGSASAIGYETAAKAYQALYWLIHRQGFRRYGLTLVAWNTNGYPLSSPLDNNHIRDDDEKEPPDTFEAYGKAIRDAMAGYRRDLNAYNTKRTNETVFLGMVAATEGRMSIDYYHEIPDDREGMNDYSARLTYWYESCLWERFDFKEKKTVVFTPSTQQIAEAVMGSQKVNEANEDAKLEKSATKQMRTLYLRLLDCITQKQPLPRDIVRCAFYRAVQPQLFRKQNENTWSEDEWRDCVATVCALIRKHHTDVHDIPERLNNAALMERNRDRSYLFGRLLAVADFVEYDATQRKSGKMTNALSLMPAFVSRPAEIWLQLHGKLVPYFEKLSPYKAYQYQNWIGQIEGLFRIEDRMAKDSLGEMFLPGYYSQRQALYREDSVPDGEPFVWRNDRSVLYGYMAAIAERAEMCADGERAGRTNALRKSEMMIRRPVNTWMLLHERTIPYLSKNGSCSRYDTTLLHACECRFCTKDREGKDSLDSGFLYGYYTMRCAGISSKFDFSAYSSFALPISRDDAFGQLLALENRIERIAMDGKQDDVKDYRLSNAFRYMSAFSRRPWSSWNLLEDKLRYYLKRVPGDLSEPVKQQIETLKSIIHENGWDHDVMLEGTYLHTFYKF